MALFRVTTQKRINALNNEKWVNTYWIDALGVNTALDAGELIAGYEMETTCDDIEVYRITAKAMPSGPTAQRGVSIPGQYAIVPENLVPLFNTVRVILTDEVGRQESKYLRGMIAEANVQGFLISGELKTAIEDNYLTPLLAVLGLRGPNDEVISGGSVQQLIQMRQISWHRRTRPGYHRGWVPD
jgi:hypothetical protein